MNPIDKYRAAALLLAALDDDKTAVDAILDEAHAAEGGIAGLIAALAGGLCELLLNTCGEQATRRTLSMTLLDASLHR